MSDPRPLLYDTYEGTGIPNWEILKVGCAGVYIRGHDGMYLDPLACPAILAAELAGVPWGLYHVLKTSATPQQQVEKWLRELPRRGPLPRCIDYEESRVLKTIPNAAQLAEAVGRLEIQEKRTALIYSRANLIDVHLKSWTVGNLNSRWWWLAAYYTDQAKYGEMPFEKVTLPARVLRERIVLHQNSDKLPPPAGAFPPPPIGCRAIDRNRWVGVKPVMPAPDRIYPLEDFIGDNS